MNLSHLHYFIALADERHFARTAKKLGIARTFLLTRYGEEFYRYTSLALHNLQTGQDNVRALVESRGEHLRLGVLCAMQDENWARLIRSFKQSTDPTVAVDLVQDFSAELIHKLASGMLDLTFATRLDDAPEGLTFTPYWSQQLVVAVNKDSPLAQRKSLTFDDLRDLSIYSYAPGCPPHDLIQNFVDEYGLDIKASFKDEVTICSMVTADEDAVAFVDYSFLIKVFKSVVCLPIEGVPLDFHQIYLVHRSDEPLSNAQQRFIEFAESHPIPPARLGASETND